jgi:hypothetical protein
MEHRPNSWKGYSRCPQRRSRMVPAPNIFEGITPWALARLGLRLGLESGMTFGPGAWRR